MARPPETVTELVDVAHKRDVGFRKRGLRLTKRRLVGVDGKRRFYEVTAVKAGNTWTMIYTTQSDGSPGKFYDITDETGERWHPNPDVGWEAKTRRRDDRLPKDRLPRDRPS